MPEDKAVASLKIRCRTNIDRITGIEGYAHAKSTYGVLKMYDGRHTLPLPVNRTMLVPPLTQIAVAAAYLTISGSEKSEVDTM